LKRQLPAFRRLLLEFVSIQEASHHLFVRGDPAGLNVLKASLYVPAEFLLVLLRERKILVIPGLFRHAPTILPPPCA
jgi:hypothetical protein